LCSFLVVCSSDVKQCTSSSALPLAALRCQSITNTWVVSPYGYSKSARSGSETWQSEEQTMPCDAKRCTETQTRQAARKAQAALRCQSITNTWVVSPYGQGGSETWQSEEQNMSCGARRAQRQDGRAESHHLNNSFFSSSSNFTPASAATNISAPVFVLYQH
jgi:hypothetical protein